MTATRPAQPTQPAARLDPVTALPALPTRAVTVSQVEEAVTQMQARSGLPAAELILAVLHVLDLTVVPDPVLPRQR